MPRAIQQTEKLLELLHGTSLRFVVIGGVAAVAHGSTIATRDLDVALELTPENLRVLLEALAPYHPHHATRPDLGVVSQSPEELSRFRLLLLDTDLGRLDVLGEVEPIGGVARLRTSDLELVPGKLFRVLEIDQLIEVKAHLGRPKDRLVEAELVAIQGALRSRNATNSSGRDGAKDP